MPNILSNEDAFNEAMLKQAVIQDYRKELASIPSEQELAKTLSYSPRHIARMKKLFAAYERREFARRFFAAVKKTATAAAIVLVVLFGLLMLNPNIRAVVVDTIVEWFETFTKFQSPQTETTVFDTGWRPSYVPEGFAEADVFAPADTEQVSVLYRSETQRMIFTYCLANSSASVDNEDIIYQEQTIEGVLFYIFEAENGDDDNILIWEKENIRFTLTSTLSINELLLVAQSISNS